MKKLSFFVVGLTVLLALAVSTQAQEWYDTSWQYRIPVTVGSPCGEAVTDYQVQIVLDDSFDFSKPLEDGSDLRVTDNDGVSIIPYWIEEWYTEEP